MNTLTTRINEATLSAFCRARANRTYAKAHRDKGQASLEYTGLILIVGAGMIVGTALLNNFNGMEGNGGFLAKKVITAIQGAFDKFLTAVGVGSGGGQPQPTGSPSPTST